MFKGVGYRGGWLGVLGILVIVAASVAGFVLNYNEQLALDSGTVYDAGPAMVAPAVAVVIGLALVIARKRPPPD